MIVSSAGQLLTPSNSMSITAEIRASDVGRIISTVSMSTVSSQDGTIKGILPDLAPNIYYLGLFVDYANGQPDFRVGVARIEILPTGSLRSITDASGLNVQISETKQVLDIKLDATPSAAVAAYYAGKAKQAFDSLSAYSHARDDGQDTQISARVTLTTYNANRTNDLNAIAGKLSISDTTSLVRKRTGYDLSQNNYSNSEKSKLAGLPSSVYSTSQTNDLLILKTEYQVKASYAAMLTIPSSPNTLIVVQVVSDENKNSAYQEYKIWPNGVRTWAAQVKDN